MNGNLQTTATIRQRGQLTIPNEIREQIAWLKPNDVVEIETRDSKEIVVKPYTKVKSSNQERWAKTWQAIEVARSFKGKRGNLSKFIVEDRERH